MVIKKVRLVVARTLPIGAVQNGLALLIADPR